MDRQIAVINIDLFLFSSTIGELVEKAQISGNIDLADNIADVDIFIGKYDLENFILHKTQLCGTEQILKNIKNRLIEQNHRRIDLDNVNDILQALSGSYGFNTAYDVVSSFDEQEQKILIDWLCVQKIINSTQFAGLKVGFDIEDEGALQVKVMDAVQAYIKHPEVSHFTDKTDFTVIPNYYWIQQILENKKFNKEMK